MISPLSTSGAYMYWLSAFILIDVQQMFLSWIFRRKWTWLQKHVAQLHLRPQTSRREMRAHWVVWVNLSGSSSAVAAFILVLNVSGTQSLYPFTPECSSLHFISFPLKASQGPSIPDALKNYSWSIFGRDYVPETSTSYQGSRHKVHRDWRILLGRYILYLSLVHQLLWFSYDLLFGVMCR